MAAFTFNGCSIDVADRAAAVAIMTACAAVLPADSGCTRVLVGTFAGERLTHVAHPAAAVEWSHVDETRPVSHGGGVTWTETRRDLWGRVATVQVYTRYTDPVTGEIAGEGYRVLGVE